jgi:hypothetical protein
MQAERPPALAIAAPVTETFRKLRRDSTRFEAADPWFTSSSLFMVVLREEPI